MPCRNLLVYAVSAVFDARLLSAADPPTSPGVGFAMVAVDSGQTARIHAVSVGPGGCGGGVTLEFYSAKGELLKRAVVPDLQPGRSASLDMSHNELPKGAARTEVRAVLRFGWDKGYAPSREALRVYECNLLPRLEILEEATGRTSLVLTDTKRLPAPNPPRK